MTVSVWCVIMESFFKRENLSFRKRLSISSTSVYYTIFTTKYPVILRISDHINSTFRYDMSIRNYNELKYVQGILNDRRIARKNYRKH